MTFAAAPDGVGTGWLQGMAVDPFALTLLAPLVGIADGQGRAIYELPAGTLQPTALEVLGVELGTGAEVVSSSPHRLVQLQ